MKKEAGVYVHIPFCVRKCDYCDFLSFPAGAEAREAYVQALIQEIKANTARMQEYEVPTIFLGGGTPSILRANQIQRILEAIQENYHVRPDAEISMEMNPGTYDAQELQELMGNGHAHPNRVSIGLQSADNRELKNLGRIHTYEQFLETYQGLRQAGCANVNIDLMSAIPGQTLEGWEQTLKKITDLEPEHISAYSLIIEEGTPFAERELDLPDEDTERLMYYRTQELLQQSGYQRYEISNYARPGFECRHNLSYWKRTNYLGLGLGAASLMENVRWNNTSDMKAYLETGAGNTGEAENAMRAENMKTTPEKKDADKIREQIEVLTEQEQMEEFMFLGLRMTAGVALDDFEADFGVPMTDLYATQLHELEQEGLLKVQKGKAALTSRGLDLSNYAMAKFLFDS